jgi:TM2 domain-containing membrane protein YozV
MVSQGEGIAALLLNILLLPGLGTVIWGDKKTGIIQIVLTVVGYLTTFILIGFAILAANWIWTLITGIRILQSAKQ